MAANSLRAGNSPPSCRHRAASRAFYRDSARAGRCDAYRETRLEGVCVWGGCHCHMILNIKVNFWKLTGVGFSAEASLSGNGVLSISVIHSWWLSECSRVKVILWQTFPVPPSSTPFLCPEAALPNTPPSKTAFREQRCFTLKKEQLKEKTAQRAAGPRSCFGALPQCLPSAAFRGGAEETLL